MKVLAVNGSPRRDRGETAKVLEAIIESATALGAEAETMYLADEDPRHCVHCGYPCFSDGRCNLEERATARSERIRAADALILGAPVYCWQPNALTCMFFDKFRIPQGTWIDSSNPGIPAMGIAVAGGTGSGVFPALQSMYAWFCAWRFFPLSPVPVTRYNIETVLADAKLLAGQVLGSPTLSFSNKWDHMLTYDTLPYLSYGRVDEFGWLAHRMAEYMEASGKEGKSVEEVKELLRKGEAAHEKNDFVDRAKCFMKAFDLAFPLSR